MNNIIGNIIGAGGVLYNFGYSVVVTVANARQIDIAALALKIFSQMQSFFNYWNPFNTSSNKIDETLSDADPNSVIRKKAEGLLLAKILKNVKYFSQYLPIVLSPMTLGWGNTIIDIASLVGSVLMFQTEADELGEIYGSDYHFKDVTYIHIARRVTFIFGYAASVVSVGLDLLNKWSWTAQFVAYTGSLGTICGIASIVLFILGTIFLVIENYDEYKKDLLVFNNNYVLPSLKTVREVWNYAFS